MRSANSEDEDEEGYSFEEGDAEIDSLHSSSRHSNDAPGFRFADSEDEEEDEEGGGFEEGDAESDSDAELAAVLDNANALVGRKRQKKQAPSAGGLRLWNRQPAGNNGTAVLR